MSCGNAGAGGGGGAMGAIQQKLAANQVDLDYALMKEKEWGTNGQHGRSRQQEDRWREWHDEVGRLQRERAMLESVPNINNPAGIPNDAMTEDEFLGARGAAHHVSGAGIDKIGGANQTGLTERQRRKLYSQIDREADEYFERRTAARAEYRRLINAGIIRDKTTIEEIVTRAHENPELSSTQAARRMAEKKGIDWRTGKKKK